MQIYCSVTLQYQEALNTSIILSKPAGEMFPPKDAVDQKWTQKKGGQAPQWQERFVYRLDKRSQNGFYMLEIGLWNKNLVLSDNLLSRALVQIHSKQESGSNTEWFTLKNDQDEVIGKLLVSIAKEPIDKEGIPHGASGIGDGLLATQDDTLIQTQQISNDYTHLVQNTEEVEAMDGDLDETDNI